MVLRTPARLEDSVCLLCLPRPGVDMEQETCTVTGYGRPLAPQPDGGNQRGNIFSVTKNICPHHSPATRLGVLGGRHHGRRDQGGRARAPRPGAVRGAPRRRGV